MRPSLYSVIKESRDPWIISEQKRVINERDDAAFAAFVFKNYHSDQFYRALVESYCVKFPSDAPKAMLAVRKSRLLEYDMSGDSEKLDKKGGFFKKAGNWFKKAIRGVGDAMYDMKRGAFGDKEMEAAEEEYDAIMDKYDETSERNIKKLFNSIKVDYPSFPNIDKDEDVERAIRVNKLPKNTSAQGCFIHALSKIAMMYDSIVASVEAGPQNGGITADMANETIADLRAATNMMSKKLSAVYRKFESDEPEGNVLDEEDMIHERPGMGQGYSGGEEGGEKKSKLKIGSEEDTEETKGNKKQLLEKILIGVGASAALIAFLIKLGVLEMIVKWLFSSGTPDPSKVPNNILEAVQECQDSGLTQSLPGVGPNSTGADIIKAGIKEGYWNNNGEITDKLKKAWEIAGHDTSKSADILKNSLFNPANAAKKASQFWGLKSFSGHEALSLVTTKTIGYVAKKAVAEGVKAGAAGITSTGAAILATGTAMAPYLLWGGAAAVAVGAASLYLKRKGLKTSRAAALQGLINIMKDVKGPSPKEPDVQVEIPDGSSPTAGGPPSPSEVESVLGNKEIVALLQKLVKDNEDLKKELETLKKDPGKIKDIDPAEGGPEGEAAAAITAASALPQNEPPPPEAINTLQAAVERVPEEPGQEEGAADTSGKISLKALIADIPEEAIKKDAYNKPDASAMKDILKQFQGNVSGVAITQSVRKNIGDELRIRLDKAIRELLKDKVVESRHSKREKDDVILERWNKLAGL